MRDWIRFWVEVAANDEMSKQTVDALNAWSIMLFQQKRARSLFTDAERKLIGNPFDRNEWRK